MPFAIRLDRGKFVSVVLLLLMPLCAAGTDGAFAAELRISWASVNESDLRGYRLRYRTDPGTETEVIDLGPGTAFTVSGLELDTTYAFAVSAYDDADNESAPSAELTARIPSSLAPLPVVTGAISTSSRSMYLARSHHQTVRFSGLNLRPGAVISLGSDILVHPPTTAPGGDLLAVVEVAEDAVLGPRVATVANPDQGIGSTSHLLQVVKTPDGNGDCAVDILDLNALARAWNEVLGEGRFLHGSDLDKDDFVGPDDLTILVRFLGLKPWGCP
jgi:hypothetical protein